MNDQPDTVEVAKARYGWVDCAPELIASALHLPSGSRLIGAEWAYPYGLPVLRLLVDSAELEAVAEGCTIPTYDPMIHDLSAEVDGRVMHRFEWEWGSPRWPA